MLKYLLMAAFSFFSLFGCKSNKNKTSRYVAKQITIDNLKEELISLQQNKTEFDFIGITSNGIDCIYFVKNNTNFDIEYEAMSLDQVPFIEKLKSFSDENKLIYSELTYGNKPEYTSNSTAPVIRIHSNSNIEKTVEWAMKIQFNLFNNSKATVYDVVP